MSSVSLAGLRVLLTRPEGDGADDWTAAFASAGAVPIAYPTIAAVAPESWDEADAALARLRDYDWLVVTSQTAVGFLVGRLPGRRFPAPFSVRLAAVGAKTAHAVEQAGGRVARVAADPRQEGLVQALADLSPGTRVLLPMAAEGRPLLAESLRAQGCVVDVLVVYRTQAKRDLPPPPPFDVATFASPSALRAFIAGPGKPVLAGKAIAVIGPTTAAAAAAEGLDACVAKAPSAAGLIRAIADAGLAKGDR